MLNSYFKHFCKWHTYFIIIIILIYYFFHDDLELSDQSPALEEKNTQVKDRPGLGSVPQNEPITTDQEKQRTTDRRASITCAQVILISGKEIQREMIVFDPDVGKLICLKIFKDISDKAIVVDMNKAGIGGFFLFL